VNWSEQETYEIDDAHCIRATDGALLVVAPEFDAETWVPISQVIEERSDVLAEGDSGSLFITLWFAKQIGLWT